MAAKFKVFTWSDGFHVYTVAATSRVKALASWGVARDLFKDGDAREIAEGPDHDAAVASPGETIRRRSSVDIGKVSSVEKPHTPSKAAAEQVLKLERKLAELTADHETARAETADRRLRLDEEAAASEQAFQDRSGAIAAALQAARRKPGA